MKNVSEVPDDFPKVGAASGLGGVQNKFSAVKYDGKYYVPGNTPPERLQQWLACEELVQAYAAKCRKSKDGKRAHMSTEEILVGYYGAAVNAHTDIDIMQLRWVFHAVAKKLGWNAVELPGERA